MSDQQQTTSSDPVRTETGTIVDQTKPVDSKATTPMEPKVEPKPGVTQSEKASEKPSVLNEKDGAEAPKEYEAFKVPDGYELDTTVAKEAGALFKGMNLSQTDAQKLVDFYVSKTTESAEAPYKFWEETQEKWVNEVRADPQIGSKLPQVKTAVSK